MVYSIPNIPKLVCHTECEECVLKLFIWYA